MIEEDIVYIMESFDIPREHAIDLLRKGIKTSTMMEGVNLFETELKNVTKEFENAVNEIRKRGDIK